MAFESKKGGKHFYNPILKEVSVGIFSVIHFMKRLATDPLINFIDQAKEITISQNPQSGEEPKGSFYSTQNLTHQFLEPEVEAL